MAKNTKKLEEKAIALITKKDSLYFIEDLPPLLAISKSTFYAKKLHESDGIKDALDLNRINAKSKLRSKWYLSEAPALQLALYKIISTDEERKSLSMHYSDITSNGKTISNLPVDNIDKEIEELNAMSNVGTKMVTKPAAKKKPVKKKTKTKAKK